ncbi:Tim44-like domain [Trinorchestia longiramus]|nr:Tim44-like domain [Trinorchestia longiramus]
MASNMMRLLYKGLQVSPLCNQHLQLVRLSQPLRCSRNTCVRSLCSTQTVLSCHQHEPLLSSQAQTPLSYRNYSTPQRSNSFFGRMLDNLRDEAKKNSEMKKSIENFKKDMEEMSKSETVVKAREKYYKIEEETAEGSRKARQTLEQLKQKVSKTVEDAQTNEMLQKASKISEDARERVAQMGSRISQTSETISKTRGAQTVRQMTQEMAQELKASELSGSRMKVYRPPTKLRMRRGVNPEAQQRIIEANLDATGVVLHKDSRFSQSWQNFRDNNPYVNRVLEWKNRLDESDHIIVRATSVVKEKLSEVLGPMFNSTDQSKTLTEICKMDPDFTMEAFMLELEYDILPNILEAMFQPDLKVLEDWSYERAYSIIAAEFKQNAVLGHHRKIKVLELDNLELMMGKVLDEGPILAFMFRVQLIDCTYNSQGEIVDGSTDSVVRRQYVMVFCRDQAELDPRCAWKLLEFTYNSATQLV